MDNTNSTPEMPLIPENLQILWILLTGFMSLFSNLLSDVDLLLAVLTKLVSLISFVLFVIINWHTIVLRFKEIWASISSLFVKNDKEG